MKKGILIVLAWFLVCFTASVGIVSVQGCKTSQQKVAYNTIFSVEKATMAAYDAYLDQVVTGKISTNGLPRVAKAFNTFQAVALVSLDRVQYNTNALAPENLLVQSSNVINLINQIKKDTE